MGDSEMDMDDMGDMGQYGDEDMGDMGYGDEQYGDEMGEGQMMEMGDYDQDDDEESMNFDENPEYAHMPKLDRMRKIRRDILRTINDVREAHGVGQIFIDHCANKAANDYANYLMTNPEDEATAAEICKENNVVGTTIPLVGFAVLEEDEDHQPSLPEQMMDAHGLLLELQYEIGVLCAKENTHIGIGFAFSKEQVKVVEFVSQKTLMIHQLNEDNEGGIEVRGTVLNKEIGLYAARVAALNKLGRDVKVCGPANIHMERKSGDFVINMPGPIDGFFYNSSDPKVIQFYIRRTHADKIKYGVDEGERINVTHLELALTLPLEYIPDPRTVLEDAADMEKNERERMMRNKKLEEQQLVKQAERIARQAAKQQQKDALIAANQARKAEMSEDEGSENSDSKGSKKKGDGSGSEEQGEDGSQQMESSQDDDYGEESEDSDEIAELPSQNEMKQDLIQAIEEELREQDSLRRENEELQKQIIAFDNEYTQNEKQPDVQMNEHKYLNTLANVHQVRINLKETQDRYNKMASELQAKLNEKQAKCHEIEQQFKELKRSVASNAVFSRTGKKIPKKTLEDWEDSESLKDQEVHQYRLQNIALRNRLANKEKILKKKEQLADGLHLIDFEQLKIENQTLNEKIEERNEELHKLRTKITQTVVILSHTREKLQYVQSQNVSHTKLHQDLTENLNADKHEQSKLKKHREVLLKTNQKLRQQTGIVNKKELKEDFDRRDTEITDLEEQIKMLQVQHQRLTNIIEQANDIQVRNMGN